MGFENLIIGVTGYTFVVVIIIIKLIFLSFLVIIGNALDVDTKEFLEAGAGMIENIIIVVAIIIIICCCCCC